MPDRSAAVTRVLAPICEPVDISFRIRLALRGADDEMVLEAALNGRADAIVTRNAGDFAPAGVFGIEIAPRGDRTETGPMTDALRYRYPLRLPASLKEIATRLAKEDGVSLNQWIVAAVAQKIGAVETAETFLHERAGSACEGDLSRYLEKAPDAPPEPGDELPG